MLQQLNLDQELNTQVKNLSGGFKRRLMLGIALIGNPDFLFLDEPSSGVDPASRKEIWKVLMHIKKYRKTGITFLTTHHLEEAEMLADDVKVLVRGKIYC